MQRSPIILSSSVDGELIRYVAGCLNGENVVEVFVTVSEAEYRESAKGDRWVRFGLRLKMYLLHPLRLCLRLFRAPKQTYCFVTTNPFFAPALCALVARIKGQKVVQILYDLFPDALEEAGLIPQGGLYARLLGVFPRMAFNYAHTTVFLGQGLKKHSEGRWGVAMRSEVIPVVLSQTITDIPKKCNSGPITIHYGGQLGWMHDAELLVSLIADFYGNESASIHELVNWSFRISGAKARMFKEKMARFELEIGPTLPVIEWRARAIQTEVGLVTLSEGGARVCLPSKTYGMMACGMAILAICPAESDLGRLISDNELGWVVDSTKADVAERFKSTIGQIVGNPEELLRRRQNAWNHISSEYALDHGGGRWRVLWDKAH